MRYRFSENEQFNYEILLALGATWQQGADVGEVLTAASAATDGDAETWVSTWATLARAVHARAEKCAAHGRAVSARDAYLRAAGYFGTALVAVDGCVDPEARLAELFPAHRDCFDRFAAACRVPRNWSASRRPKARICTASRWAAPSSSSGSSTGWTRAWPPVPRREADPDDPAQLPDSFSGRSSLGRTITNPSPSRRS